MSSLFGGGKAAMPQPVPVNPVDDSAARAKRMEVERAALADSKARGRQSTVAAGGLMAAEEQMASGLLKVKQRSAAAAGLLG